MSSEPGGGLPRVVGSYRVVREVSRGTLGTVAEAVHRPTGEAVRLEVLRPEWACLPGYVARLARDAFAASQVAHPNLVRIIDFGQSQGRFYLATERVDGVNLADRVRGQGALPAPQAVAHALQAARGLRYAHAQGLSHGDVTADNLLVDRDGLTRLAGLGLSRTPAAVEAEEAREAKAPVPVGAEAAAEAAAAPARADARGLGLALVFLLTGKTEAHPTALIAAGLPMNLVELVRSMVEPRPGTGPDDLVRLVPALERFLNARGPGGGATVPRADDARVLAESATAFRASPSALLRRRIVLGGVAACAAVVLMGLLARRPLFAGSVLGLGAMTALADFVAAGLTRKSPLFPKVRGLVVESRGGDLLIGLALAGVFVAALVAFGYHWAWLLFGLLAGCLAAWLHVTVGDRAEAERRLAVEEAEALVRRLRLQGVSEETLRGFVRTTAGPDWEEFFEALFGAEAMRAARDPSERGLRGALRRKTAPGRDAVAAWVAARQEARRTERDRALLQAVEERRLVAEGVNEMTARRRSRRIAEALVVYAAELRAAARADARSPGSEAADRPTVAGAVRRAVEAPEDVLVDREPGPARPDLSTVCDILYGPRTRFLVGSALLAGFLLWVRQNEVIDAGQVRAAVTVAAEAADPLAALRNARVDVRLDGATKPLALPFLPGPVAGLFRGVNSGVAGLILVVSALLGGSRLGLFAAPGAALALFGPSLGLPPTTAMVVGAAVPAAAVVLGVARDRG